MKKHFQPIEERRKGREDWTPWQLYMLGVQQSRMDQDPYYLANLEARSKAFLAQFPDDTEGRK